MPKRNPTSRLVYSTDGGRVRAKPDAPAAAAPPSDGVVRIHRQTKGRKGAGVSIIRGLPLAGAELTALAKQLKARCGTGGTVKNGEIEIQGDHREALKTALSEAGYTVKLAGG